jgi:hypothetical protein
MSNQQQRTRRTRNAIAERVEYGFTRDNPPMAKAGAGPTRRNNGSRNAYAYHEGHKQGHAGECWRIAAYAGGRSAVQYRGNDRRWRNYSKGVGTYVATPNGKVI